MILHDPSLLQNTFLDECLFSEHVLTTFYLNYLFVTRHLDIE